MLLKIIFLSFGCKGNLLILLWFSCYSHVGLRVIESFNIYKILFKLKNGRLSGPSGGTRCIKTTPNALFQDGVRCALSPHSGEACGVRKPTIELWPHVFSFLPPFFFSSFLEKHVGHYKKTNKSSYLFLESN